MYMHAHDSLERNPSLSRRCKEGRKMEVMTLAPMGGFGVRREEKRNDRRREDKREPWLGQRFLELQKLLRNCEALGRLGNDDR